MVGKRHLQAFDDDERRAELAVEATTEAGTVYNSPLTIPVSLYVIDTSFFHNYLTAVYNH